MKKIIFTMCFLFAASVSICFGGERAHHDSYFDAYTGHKYIKIDVNTYAEYSKRGEFIKNVSSDLPLLTKSSNIHPITSDSFILYERLSQGSSNQQLLPGQKNHPDGWKATKLFVAIN